MKKALALAIVFLWAGAALAQHHGVIRGGSAPPRTYGSSHGFGNVVFPGTGSAPPIINPFYTHPTTHAQRLGATISGFPGYTPGYRPGGGARGRSAPLVVPYAVPVFVGGYGYDYAPPQPVTVVPAPSMTPVIINQYYTSEGARPVMRDYSQTPLPETPARMPSNQAPASSLPDPKAVREDRPTVYLIAFKDGSIQAAYGFWLDNDTVHYISTKGSHNRVSIELVDRPFSEQLNRERGIEFKLE